VQVDFYHLTAQPLDHVLPRIAEKVLGAGDRLLIVAGDPQRRAWIDRLLWTYSVESFVPHGEAGAGDDARQPVLIAGETVAANGARLIALADGVWRDDALGFDRAFNLFEGETIGPARAAWRALADRDGVERRYWKQDDRGRWQQAG